MNDATERTGIPEPSEAEVIAGAREFLNPLAKNRHFKDAIRAVLRAAARVRGTDVAISDLCADEIADAYARGRRDEKEAAAKIRSESNGWDRRGIYRAD